MNITKQYLRENPDHVFVFGDNLLRYGCGGAAALRYESNSYGFVTKIKPDNNENSFYKPSDYYSIYRQEIIKLIDIVLQNPQKTYLISKLGAGLANKYLIWEQIIEPNIKIDLNLPNVKFLW
jgi:hypothetical protein